MLDPVHLSVAIARLLLVFSDGRSRRGPARHARGDWDAHQAGTPIAVDMIRCD
jgi:hypothetical protein